MGPGSQQPVSWHRRSERRRDQRIRALVAAGLLAAAAIGACSPAPTARVDARHPGTGPADAFESGAVRLLRRTSVGNSEAPGIICRVRPEGVAMLADGGLAVQSCDCATVLVFDRDGEYTRTIGPSCGEGPGELQMFLSVASTSTGDVLVSGEPGKMLRYGLAGGELRDELRVQHNAVVAGVFPDGRRLLKYADYSRMADEGVVRGLHIHDEISGGRLSSFYSVAASGDPGIRWSHVSQFDTVFDDRGHVWTVRKENAYEITEWDASGNLVRVFNEAPAWFRAYPEPYTASRARVEAVAWSDGYLWILAESPLEWRDDPGLPSDIPFANSKEALDAYRASAPPRQWVVAAVDPSTGRIVGEGGFPAQIQNLRMFVGTNGGFFRNEVDDDGNVRVTLFEPQLLRDQPPSSAAR